MLPDTQIYARDFPEIFDAQTRWIADHALEYNIVFVLHEGDIVDNNSPEQWSVAAGAMGALDDAGVPYVLAIGNHDMGPLGGATTRESLLDEFFPVEAAASRGLAETFDGSIANGYYVLDTPDGRWLVLSLEFGPRDAVVEWADGVLSDNAELRTIVLTHAYLYHDDTRYDRGTRPDQMWSPYDYGISELEGGVNDGAELFERLISVHSQIEIVFSGHVLGDGVGRLSSPQVRGTGTAEVHQLLANYQNRSNGGDGFLRLVEVDAGANQLRVWTCSATLEACRDSDEDRFDLDLPDFVP